ncbi:hypothetical protein CHELA40_11923 [Chelatococcus asaccharovorans]|nr:hypothetical protein CHELA40_11923 [Chelatococcus asaccharovorans]CAH1683793.1 hypothetical protein CHELA17_63677 [Chelatococcus asaccharovorans]
MPAPNVAAEDAGARPPACLPIASLLPCIMVAALPSVPEVRRAGTPCIVDSPSRGGANPIDR